MTSDVISPNHPHDLLKWPQSHTNCITRGTCSLYQMKRHAPVAFSIKSFLQEMSVENPSCAGSSSQHWGWSREHSMPMSSLVEVPIGEDPGRQRVNKSVFCQIMGNALKNIQHSGGRWHGKGHCFDWVIREGSLREVPYESRHCIWGKRVPGRGNSKGSGLGVGAWLVR